MTSSDRPTCSLARPANYSKPVFNRYSTRAHSFKPTHWTTRELAEIFEPYTQTISNFQGNSESYGERGDGMGEGQCKKVWLTLIDAGPN